MGTLLLILAHRTHFTEAEVEGADGAAAAGADCSPRGRGGAAAPADTAGGKGRLGGGGLGAGGLGGPGGPHGDGIHLVVPRGVHQGDERHHAVGAGWGKGWGAATPAVDGAGVQHQGHSGGRGEGCLHPGVWQTPVACRHSQPL